MTNIATVIFEDQGAAPTPAVTAGWRARRGAELAGIEKLPGSYPFTLETSHRAWRLNDFLHRLVEPEHRRRFLEDFDGLASEHGLDAEERRLVAELDWIGLIRFGVIFFMQEKLGAVVGVSNPEMYAAMRGEDLETFQRSRKVAMQYSVGAGT